MERGYWLPPRAKHLAAYAGFYIDSETVYQANMDSGWNQLLDGLCQSSPTMNHPFRSDAHGQTSKLAETALSS
ncbi:MAG: hypothetical protein ACLSS9_00210 [Acutalibacteraceae bacterium]